jgi:hypothetical protein
MDSLNLHGECPMARYALSCLLILLGVMASMSPTISAKAPPKPAPPKPSPAEVAAEKKAEAQMKQQMEAPVKAQEALVLRSVFILLAGANNNYDGHKAKAMHEVERALSLLDAHATKKAQGRIKALQGLHQDTMAKLLPKPSDTTDIMQALSDAQVANAAAMLGQLAPGLATHKQPQVLTHVQNAVKELGACPKHVALSALKGQETHVLTAAYILMASANHDYDGHRAKAMNWIVEACNKLEVDILKNAIVEDKIKAIQDANAETVEKNKANEDAILHEPQAISDAQLLMADALIQQIGVFMKANKQNDVVGLVGSAQKELGIALSIR